MLRYLRRLADRDLALDRTMIPLGSCTMKLNATTEMMPITWPEFADIHPFAPVDQADGLPGADRRARAMLAEITGYDAVSLQPNAGTQGELAGLLAIRAYHRSRGDDRPRRLPDPVVGARHQRGQRGDGRHARRGRGVRRRRQRRPRRPRAKADEHAGDRLAALMVTYPSTHGVFEERHRARSAPSSTTTAARCTSTAPTSTRSSAWPSPGSFGADVSHLNLHKTFCIPHGGGGPGVGPVGGAGPPRAVPAQPPAAPSRARRASARCRAAPWGSAGILPISWAYIALMGADGLRDATEVAILNANYVARRLAPHYPGALHRARTGWSRTSASSTCARSPRPPASPSTTSPSG